MHVLRDKPYFPALHSLSGNVGDLDYERRGETGHNGNWQSNKVTGATLVG